MKFKRILLPRRCEPVQVACHHTLILNSQTAQATLDGQAQKVNLGCWMFYLPEKQEKFFHAVQGMIDCTHSSRPADRDLDQGELQVGRYRMNEWREALQTSIYRRLAEVWLVSVRLWASGMGPQPLGVCYVRELIRDDVDAGPTCGILTQNVYALPRKLNCTLDQIREAGVLPDKILSCVRQQVRGYVVDLCSVVGCRPENSEEEIDRLENLFRQIPPPDSLKKILEDSLRDARMSMEC